MNTRIISTGAVDELKVVAAPRHIRECIVNDCRHNIHVVLLGNGSEVDGITV